MYNESEGAYTMKLLFYSLFIIHGLIHILGFLKSFNIVGAGGFNTSISKTAGVIWLIAMLLFLFAGILVFLNKEWVWIPAIIAVLVSQTLIFLTWQDAKFGSIPNIIILIFAIFSFASWNFNNLIEKELESLQSGVTVRESNTITEESLVTLPVSVQKWLKNSGIVGKKQIQSVYFKQKAKMKLKPDQADWYPANVEQYVTIDQPGFLWKVTTKMFSFVNVVGRDKFQDGQAEMTIKIGSLIPVVNAENDKKTNQSTLQRYLMELLWYPSAALHPSITWEEVDRHTAKATMNYKGTSGSATFEFDDDGNFLKVTAFRFKDTGDATPKECIGEAKEFGVMDGIKIPTKVNITWVLDDGLFNWYQTEVVKVEYNKMSI
jgi:hypothetical protein